MTASRRDGNEEPFNDWIRNHPELDSIRERLSVADSDYWIHQYRARRDRIGDRAIDNIMLMELKAFGAQMRYAQRDTLFLVDQITQKSVIKTVKGRSIRKTLTVIDHDRKPRLVRYYGVHVLQLESSRPDNSDYMLWDGKMIDEATLVELLKFERDPATLRPRSDRRHHMASRGQSHADLFGRMH